jgi:hypothetical protein
MAGVTAMPVTLVLVVAVLGMRLVLCVVDLGHT